MSATFFPKGAELGALVQSGRFDRDNADHRLLAREAGHERSAQFGHATQGKGKPMTYGHGSRERYLKETKG